MKSISVYKYRTDSKKYGVVVSLKKNVDFDAYVKKQNDKGVYVLKVKKPSMKTLEKWSYDGIVKAVDGCKIEPDGICEHGFPSFLIAMGMI